MGRAVRWADTPPQHGTEPPQPATQLTAEALAKLHNASVDEELVKLGWGVTAAMKKTDHAAPEASASEMTDATASVPSTREVVPPATPTDVGVPSTPAGVEGKCYSRRAAANLLSRRRNNQARMAALNSNLRNQLLNLDEAGRTALVTSLCECNGDLDALNASFETETLNEEFSRNTSTLEPYTEQEVINKYGSAKAEEVMNYKRRTGLTQDDPNAPGTTLFLLAKDKMPGAHFSG